MFFVTLAGVIAVLVYTGVTKQQLDVLQGQVNDARAQQSAFLAFPDDPPTIVKMDNGWHFILDFYIANVGQTAARETYINATLTMKGNGDAIPAYTGSIAGGPILITPQKPYHYVFDLGLPLNTTVYNGIPKPGEAPRTSTMILLPVQNLIISLKGQMAFTTVFNKTISSTIDLIAGFTDERIKCCDFLQLQTGVPMTSRDDLTRIPPDETAQPESSQKH
jgi:hypothetical protein